MEILTKDMFPILGMDKDVVRIAMTHQSILKDIRIQAKKINLDECSKEELEKFVVFCRDKTE